MKNFHYRRPRWPVLLAFVVLCGCQKPSAPAGAAGEVVAVVGDKRITVDDFRAKLDEQSPFLRARYSSLERKKEFLDNLTRFEVLLQEAKRRRLESDPEVRAMLDKVLVQRLIKVHSEEVEKSASLDEAALRKYYDDHLTEFARPERVRVAHVFIASAKGDPERASAQKQAGAALADLKGKESANDGEFGQFARKRSDDLSTRDSGGELGFKTREELQQAWGAEFANAAFALKTFGELGPVVATDRGLHLIKLLGRQSGVEQSFDSAKDRLRDRLAMERRGKALDEFIAGLKTSAGVKVFDDVLAGIEVKGASAEPASTPSP